MNVDIFRHPKEWEMSMRWKRARLHQFPSMSVVKISPTRKDKVGQNGLKGLISLTEQKVAKNRQIYHNANTQLIVPLGNFSRPQELLTPAQRLLCVIAQENIRNLTDQHGNEPNVWEYLDLASPENDLHGNPHDTFKIERALNDPNIAFGEDVPAVVFRRRNAQDSVYTDPIEATRAFARQTNYAFLSLKVEPADALSLVA